MSGSAVLIIVTSISTMAEGHPTGVWLEELTTPYYLFRDAGLPTTIASVAGGIVPIDPRSVKVAGENTTSVERFLADKALQHEVNNTVSVDDIDVADFSAVFLPGGHGTMWDFPTSSALVRLLESAWLRGRVIAAVCHGPAGLIGVKDATGAPLVRGRRLTAFTDAEERAVGLDATVPFLLETHLRELGAEFENASEFCPFVITDGNLITGQNPASSEPVANATIKRLIQA